MLTWEDCIAWCELNEAEIDAIAAHEHIPEMAALALGAYLCQTADGQPAIRRMILDDIAAAPAPVRPARALLVGVFRLMVCSQLGFYGASRGPDPDPAPIAKIDPSQSIRRSRCRILFLKSGSLCSAVDRRGFRCGVSGQEPDTIDRERIQ